MLGDALRRPGCRPTGRGSSWLDDFELPDELWARFEIPIGLAFFMRTGAPARVVALYPSPAGATESELDPDAWEELRSREPGARRLEPDAEALIVNRMSEPQQYAIAPIDECYRLVGMIKVELGGDLRRAGAGGGDRAILRRAAGEERRR